MISGVWRVECDGVFVDELTHTDYKAIVKEVKTNWMLYPLQMVHLNYVAFRLFLECLPMATIFSLLLVGLYAMLGDNEVNSHFAFGASGFFALIIQVTIGASLLGATSIPFFYGFRNMGFRNLKAEQFNVKICQKLSLNPGSALTFTFIPKNITPQ